MRHILQTILVCPIFVSAPAFGADVLSGRDAAYIDWGVKYCGGMSTDKEHAMVEQANARTREHFIQEYTKESNKLAAVASAPEKQERVCSDIKAWHGPLGNRIADLLRWKEPPLDARSKATTDNSAKRRGRRPSIQW